MGYVRVTIQAPNGEFSAEIDENADENKEALLVQLAKEIELPNPQEHDMFFSNSRGLIEGSTILITKKDPKLVKSVKKL